MTDQYLPADRFTEGEFRIGRVFGRAWLLLARNGVKLIPITLIGSLPVLLALGLAPGAVPPNQFQNLRGSLSLLLFIVLGIACHAALLQAAAQAMGGRTVNLVEALGTGLRRFFPVIGLAICAFLAILVVAGGLVLVAAGVGALFGPTPRAGLMVAGVLAAFVAMIMLYTSWFVATAACVIEKLGPIRSLGRSRALTKGHRWRLFGLLLAILVVAMIVGAVIFGLLFAMVGAGGFPAVIILMTSTSVRVVNVLLNAIWGTYFGLVIFVAYHDLRVAKEGIGTEQIAKVFE